MNKSTPSTLLVVLAFLAVYTIWGSTYLGIRFAIETMPPFLMAGVRFLVAGLLLYGFTRWRGMESPVRIHWRSAAIVGGLMLFGGNGMVTWSEQYIASGLAAVLVATVPMWIVTIDAFRKHLYPGHQVVGGLLLGFGGVVFLMGPANVVGDTDISLIGVAGVLVAALLWASGSLYSREAPLPSAPLVAISMEMICGGLWLMLVSVITGDAMKFDANAVSTSSLVALVYLIFFGSIIGFTAYIWLLKNVEPARAATYAYVNPVIAVLLGWTLGNEALTMPIILATIMIVGAVVLITSRRGLKEQPKAVDTQTMPVLAQECA